MKINFVGDVCMHNIEKDNFLISEEIVSCFRNSDFNIANLESPLTHCERKTPYQPIYLKGLPQSNNIFELFDCYSLANNHIMDYSEDGLNDTIRFLKSQKKHYFGAGRNIEEAFKPVFFEKSGVKIAIFGYTRYNPAKKNKSGTAPVLKRLILKKIIELKSKGYFVIIFPHWNYQWVDFPSPDERFFAKKMIDKGADLIVGAHPHIVQGLEEYKGKMIFHSIGNFVFKRTKYSKPSEKLGRTYILSIDIAIDNSYSYNLIPVFSDSPGMRLMKGYEKAKFLEHIKEISNPLKDNKLARRKFYNTSSAIDKNTAFVLNEMKKDGGIKSVLSTYRIATIQDFKKKIYSVFIKRK